MKRIVLFIFFIGVVFPFFGQQLTQYSNFVTNYVMTNPASVGSVKCFEFNAGHRGQWTNVEGRPITNFANIQGKFGKRKFNFQGLGLVIESDVAGAINQTTMSIAYAYHMKVSQKHMMSFGISAGVMQYKIDYSILTPLNFNDPVIQGNVSELKAPYINTGFWLYNSKHFVGFSIRNIIGMKVKDVEDTKLIRHFELTGGRNIKLNEEFFFKPALQLKFAKGTKLDLDLQGLMSYNGVFSLGVGTRSFNEFIFLTSLTIKRYVTLRYAYDLTTSKLKFDGKNGHEFILGFSPCKKFGGGKYIKCAAYN